MEIETNRIKLNVKVAGPEDGPLVILLHGFPEFWYCWHRQIDKLAAAGYRVAVPDQRGYNKSSKPRGVAAYEIDELAADIEGLVRSLGRKKASLAGHDWGGLVSWRCAFRYPDQFERVAILNCPHPQVFLQNLRSNPAQRKKSWYIRFFQIPFLPEFWLTRRNYRNLKRSLRGSSRRGTFSDSDLEQYQTAWSQKRAVSSAVNWYRAALRKSRGLTTTGKIRPPVRLIWGTKDLFLGAEMAQPSIDLCEKGDLVMLEGTSHWVPQEEPEKTSQLLLEFFGGHTTV